MPNPVLLLPAVCVRLTVLGLATLLRAVLAALPLTMVLLIAWATPAAAHTDLDSTNPADGATLDAPLDEMTLTFTLPVTQLGDGVSLEGPDGQVRVEVSSAQEGLTWKAVPEEPLQDGRYTGEWTVAAQDGHPLSGEFRFAVETESPDSDPTDSDSAAAATEDQATSAPGDEPRGDVASTQADPSTDASGVAEVLARLGSAAALWGALVAGGALIFAKTVLKGADREDMPVIAVAIRWSAALILLGLTIRVMARAVLISQGDITAAISPTAIGDSLGGTTRWVLGLQAAGALTVLLGARPMLSPPWIAGAGLLAVGAGHVLAGHSKTIEPR